MSPRTFSGWLWALFMPVVLYAQEPVDTTTPPARTPPEPSSADLFFSGEARLSGQLADRPGAFQQTPDDFVRWEFSPSVGLYGVPFTLDVLMSTEQSEIRQRINSISFSFDYRKMQAVIIDRILKRRQEEEVEVMRKAEEVAGKGGVEEGGESVQDRIAGEQMERLQRIKEYADLEKLRERAITEGADALDRLGLITAGEKFFANFPSLGIGVTYPRYTQLTVDGVPVTGGNIEWNPGMFYVAAAGGQTQRAVRLPGIEDTIRFDPSFKRTLFSGRIGYGRRNAGHFFLTAVYTTDDASTLPFDSALGRPVTPTSNYVIGMEVVAPIVADVLQFEGELAGSMLTGDIEASEIGGKDIEDVPAWVRDLLNPRISSVLDFAATGRVSLRIPETDSRAMGSVRYIGPGFFSLGAPTVRNDQVRWDGRVEQRLHKRRILLTASIRDEHDNIVAWKSSTTSLTMWSIGAGLNFPDYPYLRVEYSPYSQVYEDPSDSLRIENATSLMTASTGYYYRLGELSSQTTLIASLQQSSTFEGLADYGATTLSLIQGVTFPSAIDVTGGITFSTLNATGSADQSVLSVDGSVGYSPWDRWYTSIGLAYARNSEEGDNVGFSIGAAIPVWNYGVFDLRAARNVYNNFVIPQSNFNEFILTASFSTRWGVGGMF